MALRETLLVLVDVPISVSVVVAVCVRVSGGLAVGEPSVSVSVTSSVRLVVSDNVNDIVPVYVSEYDECCVDEKEKESDFRGGAVMVVTVPLNSLVGVRDRELDCFIESVEDMDIDGIT